MEIGDILSIKGEGYKVIGIVNGEPVCERLGKVGAEHKAEELSAEELPPLELPAQELPPQDINIKSMKKAQLLELCKKRGLEVAGDTKVEELREMLGE